MVRKSREISHTKDFESMILKLAQNFINTPLENLENAILLALQLLAEYCGADRAVIVGCDWERGTAERQYEWAVKPEFYFNRKYLNLPDYGVANTMTMKGEVFKFSSTSELPENSEFRRTSSGLNIVSLCSYPMTINGKITGMILLTTARRKKSWSDANISAVKIFSEMMSNVLRRKEREEALKEINEINSLTLNSTSDGIVMFDTQGNLLSMNAAFKNRPFVKEHAIGKNLKEQLPPEVYGDLGEKRYNKIQQVCETGEPVLFEDSRDGIVFWNRLYPVFKDNKVHAVTLFSTDITDRKKAYEEMNRNAYLEIEAETLRKTEADYLEILDSSTEATWVKDFKNGKKKHSARWLKRIGGENVPDEDMDSFLHNLIHPDDVERVIYNRELTFKNNSAKYSAQFRVKLPDGSYIWVMNRGKITYDENGNPEKGYGTITDISKEKEYENIILKQNLILKSINMVHEKALTCRNMQELSKGVLEIIESITGSKYSFIAEIREDGSFNNIAINHPDIGAVETKTEDDKACEIHKLVKTVLQNGRSTLKNDLTFDFNEYPELKPELSSFVGIPFYRDNKVIGLVAVAKQKGKYNEEEKELLEAITPTVLEVLFRKRAEEELRENEILLRTIMDSSNDFLFIKDRDLRIVMINKAYSKIFGVELKDVVGKDYCDIHIENPEVAMKIVESERQIMSSGEKTVNEVLLKTTKGYKTFTLAKLPWRDSNGNIMGIVGVAHDITKQKKVEDSLRETVSSLERSKDYIDILYETTGKILSCTKPRKEIAGLCTKVMNFLGCDVFLNYFLEKNGQILRLNACDGLSALQKREFEFLHLCDTICECAVKDCCVKIAFNIQSSVDPRTELIRKIGINAFACHPLISEGKAIGTLSFGSRLKESFDKEELLLMKTVAESVSLAINRKQNEEMLIKQAQELRISDNNKNEFLSALSHELRNPLATIVAGLSLIDISKDEEQRNKANTIIKRQVNQLCSLVDDLLDVTRFTRNMIELKKERFELNQLVSSVSEDHKTLFDEKNLDMKTNLCSETIFIYADPVRLKQIIGNLLLNALKFTGAGGKVSLKVKKEDGRALIKIKDNGKGIEPKFMPYLFEPFMQADKSLDRRTGGLGLGLSIVKSITELHGGSVKAYSSGKGKGSEFAIMLPIIDTESGDNNEDVRPFA